MKITPPPIRQLALKKLWIVWLCTILGCIYILATATAGISLLGIGVFIYTRRWLSLLVWFVVSFAVVFAFMSFVSFPPSMGERVFAGLVSLGLNLVPGIDGHIAISKARKAIK